MTESILTEGDATEKFRQGFCSFELTHHEHGPERLPAPRIPDQLHAGVRSQTGAPSTCASSESAASTGSTSRRVEEWKLCSSAGNVAWCTSFT